MPDPITNRWQPAARMRRSFLLYLATTLTCSAINKAAYSDGVRSAMPISMSAMPPGAAGGRARTVAGISKVLTGIDVLAAEGLVRLSGLRVGLITNQTGRDAAGRRTIDVLLSAPGVKLVAIFSPEHGLRADREGKIEYETDALTGLPVHSLYGNTRRPTSEMLTGIDGLIVDLQDAGVRFYTYITTMAYAMEEAAARDLQFFVLDRPNPIGPAGVRGPVLDPALRSFTGYFSMPVQHGMTIGELAAMFNTENRIGANLTVVPMHGYERNLWFDETGLKWNNPSPNIRSLTEAILYPGVALVESTNVSVGRGTAKPFELVGAPWIDARAFASSLRRRKISGVRFASTDFIPEEDRYARVPCYGVRILLSDRSTLDAPRLGIELAAALFGLYPERFVLRDILGNLGSEETLVALESGQSTAAIVSSWQPALRAFESTRRKYLLYQ